MILPKIIKTTIEKESNSALVELYLNPDLIWFKGHFEGFYILPAVCQIAMVKHFAHDLLDLDVTIDKIPRTKFLKPARPNDTVFLSLNFDTLKNTLTFHYYNKDNATYSKGTLKLCQM